MMDKFKRWRWAIAIGAVLLAGLVFAFWPEAEPVDTGSVSRGPMQVGVTDNGVTRVEDYYVVSAPVTGYLQRIELEAGDEVARGTVITRMTGKPATPLDPRSRNELRGALAAATAAEGSAGSVLAQAQRDLNRAQELSNRGFLPRAQLEAAQTRVSTGQAALSQARAEVVRIRAMLAETGSGTSGTAIPVRAPSGGSVMSVLNESEGVIPEGTPLVTIGNPNRIEAVVDLLSREAVEVKPGDRVEITEWGGPKPIVGFVKRIEPFGKLKISALGIEEQRVNVIIGFSDDAANQTARLGHGYEIDATIVLWSADDALRVPIGALFRGTDGGWRVFVVKGGRARERPVKLGHLNDEFAEVLDGLENDQAVLLNPSNAMADGKRVKSR